jgi:putative colanic acid biosynthesis acetyltransferase WcaF
VTRVRLDHFDSKEGFDRGRPRTVEAAWYCVKCLFFLSPLPWPSRWKVLLLRLFGAVVGEGCVIKPRVNIHMPWRLTMGSHVWLGEECYILNLAPVVIGSHCCISQRVFLCTGNHDFKVERMPYRNAPIRLGDGSWVGAQSVVGPGVTIGAEAVAALGSVVTADLPAGYICRGNPCEPLKKRWKADDGATTNAA